MSLTAAEPIDLVPGDATGLLIAAHGEALRAGGEPFLTEAFRRFGALAADNSVARITRLETCPGGSTGQKFFLSVQYAHPDPDLHTDLFVKFSRDFADPLRDRGKWEMEGEVRFAALSRRPGFPIRVPTAYFADYHHASGTGILITQRIPFGTDGIEPHHEKTLDHLLPDPLAYYRVIVPALARLAAAHKSGRLSADIDTRFPYDPGSFAAVNSIRSNRQQLRDQVARYADFAKSYPQLVPANIADPAFFAKLDRDVGRFLEHEATIQLFLRSDPDLIALCHWNANIDNAWFWRDADGALQCGLMDWGHVGQMNLAFALWGSLCAAGLDIWNDHLDELLQLFTDELHAHGGPRIEVRELLLHLHCYVALMGIGWMLEAPARIMFRLPEAAHATGPHDPIFRKSETARNQLHVSTTFLNLWQTHDFGASLDRVLERQRPPR